MKTQSRYLIPVLVFFSSFSAVAAGNSVSGDLALKEVYRFLKPGIYSGVSGHKKCQVRIAPAKGYMFVSVLDPNGQGRNATVLDMGMNASENVDLVVANKDQVRIETSFYETDMEQLGRSYYLATFSITRQPHQGLLVEATQVELGQVRAQGSCLL